jgi:type IV pilus assembly protein PilA
MIILAILGILAAIAVPNFVEMQYRAKRAEVPGNVDGIKTAVLAYESINGKVVTEPVPRPDGFPGRRARAWRKGSKFDALGWAPDGDVRGSYTIHSEGKDFKITGFCDVDGDGSQVIFTATRSTNAVQTTAGTAY